MQLIELKRWPNASIVIATYNRASTLRKVLKAMLKLEYPEIMK